MAPTNRVRNAHWDNAKGLAIVAVVGIHATTMASTFPTDSSNFALGMDLRQGFDFAVPLFLAIAGYFTGLKPLGSPIEFVRNRAIRILPPYVFWTAIYRLAFRAGDLASPVAMIRHFATGSGVIIGYFVIVLSQMVILTPLIDSIETESLQIATIILTTMAGLTFTYITAVFYSGAAIAKFPYYALPFIVWYPFYHMGFLAAKWDLADRFGTRGWSIAFAVMWMAGLGASFIEASWLVHWGLPSFAGSQVKVTSMAASLALFFLFLSLSKAASIENDGILSQLGKDSYFIYFFHLLAFSVLEAALRGVPQIVDHQVAYVPALMLLTLGVCIIAAKIARALLPKRWSAVLLGL